MLCKKKVICLNSLIINELGYYLFINLFNFYKKNVFHFIIIYKTIIL